MNVGYDNVSIKFTFQFAGLNFKVIMTILIKKKQKQKKTTTTKKQQQNKKQKNKKKQTNKKKNNNKKTTKQKNKQKSLSSLSLFHLSMYFNISSHNCRVISLASSIFRLLGSRPR